MVNQRLRRAGLPVAVSAVVAAVAVVGTILANGTAGAETTPAAGPDRAAVAAAAGKLAAKHTLKDTAKQRAAAAALATDELNFGDLTGDGKADLAAIDGSGTMYVYPGKRYVWDGSGTRSKALFGTRIKVGSGWGKFTSLVRHGDFNGDSRQDILTRDTSGRLFFYAGTGNPAAMFKKGTQAGTGWGSFTSITGSGDLTGDGRDDLLGQKTTGELVLYTGTNNPAAPFKAKGAVVGTGWKGDLLTSIGEWTTDGISEFMFRNKAGAVYFYNSRPGNNPIGTRETVFDAPDGFVLKNMVGMGDLTSDSGYFPTPDVIWQLTDGTLLLVAPDTGVDFDVEIGTGWGGYRLF